MSKQIICIRYKVMSGYAYLMHHFNPSFAHYFDILLQYIGSVFFNSMSHSYINVRNMRILKVYILIMGLIEMQNMETNKATKHVKKLRALTATPLKWP